HLERRYRDSACREDRHDAATSALRDRRRATTDRRYSRSEQLDADEAGEVHSARALIPAYSLRNVVTGFTRAARVAGINVATDATRSTTTAITPPTSAILGVFSAGFSPPSWLLRR